ncbi:MAG: YmdB family metallophosphoesterase [Phycisphaerales bacterium]|jgi:2',3'-cyclic-nucleotide 2'-phosphodiesterase|nr:YmdB family metallophosphoesterase [Phycisphaerales bacterium]
MSINILCIGDVVGKPGRTVLADHLGNMIIEHNIDLVVCNPENAAGGSGLTPQIFRKLLNYGVDVMTLGDHVYRKSDIMTTLRTSERIVRPANLSARAAGKTWTVVPTKSGDVKVAVACFLGQMYMGSNDSPWDAADRVMAAIPADVKVRVVDFHAEASSEKIAMGWHLDGRASIVFGTHTHIPTADYRVLPMGTAHVSDLGMTGPYDSVLGRRKDRVLTALTTSMPVRFEVASEDVRISSVLVSVDPNTGRANSIKRIEVRHENHDDLDDM